jgi:hypothetical protein
MRFGSHSHVSVVALAAAVLFAAAPLSAQARPELGRMWTFEKPPREYLQQTYGFVPDGEWFDKVRLAALRFGRGCSASFVSPHGLILTNHHCVRGDIAANQGEHDWVKDGFVAAKQTDEVRLKGLTVQQLVATRDVTAEVLAGLEADADEAAQATVRQRNEAKILADARSARPELQHQLVALFQGAVRQLYSYKVYDDIRLVVAPHLQAAHFGGDFDNFTYPRYGIDFAFCRAYENGAPADTAAHYYEWSATGPKANDLVFVVGNPGSTERLLTHAQFQHQRDARLPRIRQLIDNRLAILRRLAAKGGAEEKQHRTMILNFENSQKAYRGMHLGLLDDRFLARKAEAEKQFRARIDGDPALKARYGDLWDKIAAVAAEQTAIEMPLNFHTAGGSIELERALVLLEIAAVAKTGGDKAALEKRLADMPARSSDQQLAFFVDHLVRAKSWLPEGDPYLVAVLRGREPEAAVAAWMADTRVGDTEAIADWIAGAPDAITESDDPALAIARVLRTLQATHRATNQKLEARLAAHGRAIGLALFDAYGTEVSPDATFTLRFGDGVVAGYDYNGTKAPWRTTFHSMFGRSAEFDGVYPFDLPEAWRAAQKPIDLDKPVNFVCTNDSTGGNSGSPVVDRDRRLVGLLFDGNIESLPNDFMFEDRVARSVCVHVVAIVESMRKVYRADRIVTELLGDR